MKKSVFWLSVPTVILATLIMAAALSRNITTGISLSQENEDNRSSIQININTASLDELTIIPGLGEGLAKKIISYRRENGPFQSVPDILNVKGIGPSTYNKIADYLTVGG